MADRFMNFIRFSMGKFHLRKRTVISLMITAVCLMLFIAFLQLFEDEFCSRYYLETYAYPENVNTDLKEVYETVLSLSNRYLRKHGLVEITGSYYLEGDEIVFDMITFSFGRSLTVTRESERVSIINAIVDLNEKRTVTLSEWVGPARGSGLFTGISLQTDPQAISIAQEILLQMALAEPDKTEFKIWRTTRDLEETGGFGEPSVRICSRRSDS